MCVNHQKNEEELMRLMHLLVDLAEDAKGTGHTDERYQDAEGLGLKVFCHVASALYLSRSTTLLDFPGVRVSFFDPASFAVLTRAAMEAFLTFHLVFVHPESEAEFEFRYCAWKRFGLLERQSFPVSTEEGRALQEQEAAIIREYEEQLRASAIVQGLPPKQKRRLDGEVWRWDLFSNKKRLSWPDIGEMAGLSRVYASHLYG